LAWFCPGTAGQRMLPDEVTLALRSDSLLEAMAGAGVPLQTAEGTGETSTATSSRGWVPISRCA
jgi:hypothetical protein